MLVLDALQNSNFSDDSFDISFIRNSSFLQNFDSDQLPTRQVLTELHVSERALTEILEERILFSNHLRPVHALHSLHMWVGLALLLLREAKWRLFSIYAFR